MGLRENLSRDLVSKLELRKVITAPSDLSVREAVRLMREDSIGCVIIVDDENKPKGIFSESMLKRLMVSNTSYLDESLEKHMADRCPWVMLTDSIQTVLEAMQVNNIRFISVLDENGKVIALTGQKGLMEYIAEHYPREVMVQRIDPDSSLLKREGA